MSLPTIEPLPDEDELLTPAQRRLRRRVITPPEGDERAGFVRDLSMLVGPSFDFYLFTLLSGLVLAVGLLLDSPALFVLSALVAPFLAPLVGTALGGISGQARFTLQSFIGLLVASLIIFLCGMMAGAGANLLSQADYIQPGFHTRLDWADLAVLLLGAGLAGYMFARAPHQKPLVASVAMAYALYLPVGSAGFGLISGVPDLFPNGLWVFLVHLMLAITLGALGLAAAGLRPWNAAGYAITLLSAVAAVALLAAAITGRILPLPEPEDLPVIAVVATSSPTVTTTVTLSPSRTPTPTDAPPTPTRTTTPTLVPTNTSTATFTPIPTPLFAQIQASEGGGALIRENPDYNATVLQSLLNGTLVEVLPEVETAGGASWIHVRLIDGREGWVVSTLLRTATPAAN